MPLMLHYAYGDPFPLPCGLVESGGSFFADNGFGEFEKVDGYPGLMFIFNGKEGFLDGEEKDGF